MSERPAFLKTMKKPEVPPDKLIVIRNKAKELRDFTLQLNSLKEQEKRVTDQINALKSKKLPDLLAEVGLDGLGLEAEGNLPAYDLKVKPYYHANIKADAPEAPEAFKWLAANGHGDIVRRTYTISFGKGEEKAAAKFETSLKKSHIQFSSAYGVPWNSLTAWLKEQIEKHKKVPPLHLFGATVGSVADLKPRQEK